MTASTLNLSIEQGASWLHSLVVNQPAPVGTPTANLVPMNLTGYTARMQVRKTVSSPHVLLELTTSNARIVITPLTGKLDLALTATATAALTFDTAVYDLEIVSSGGEVTRVIQGVVTLAPEVTR